MSTETITLLNFIVHSLVIGAAAWLLVRFVIRDALRRCILANLAVLMCLYCPFDISVRDLFPLQQHVPVLTPIRETFEHDWRVKVEPQKVMQPPVPAPDTPAWNLNDTVKWLHRFTWLVTALLLLRLLVQSIRLQRWAWRLRELTGREVAFLRDSVLECAGPPALSNVSRPAKSSRGLEHSKTLSRLRVSDGDCTPCAAGWFFPIIAVPAKAFEELTPRQWRWLIRHECEHLRTNDTVAVLLQNIALAFLWWNPFAHALIEEFARAREEACDAAAIEEEPDQSSYIDFLLTWAAKPSPSRFAMSIARSRPARRLQDRLVALMEARGVRKKVGALFVLGCAAFAVLAPFFAASFGIAPVAAQEAVKADPQDDTMFTRLYIVSPDFLPAGATARQLLEEKGIPFPEGSSAIYQASTSRLIVRHTRAGLDQIEALIDRLHQRLPQVFFQSKLIQADALIGKHESILKPEEAKELLAQVSQKKGIDLMSAPSLTTRMGQRGVVEVVREILPAKPWPQNAEIEVKRVGPRISLVALPAPNSEASIEAKIDLGIDPDAEHPWLSKNDAKPDWSRIQTFTVSSKAVLARGETLLLHLPTSKKPVTVLITAEALNPNGQKAVNFEPTVTLQPSQTAMTVPDKAANEWAVRVYKLPESFSQDKPPAEVLKAEGITFPKGADAALKDGKLTVRNTKPNLALIEALLETMWHAERRNRKQVFVSVIMVEVKKEWSKLQHEWFPPQPDTPTAATPVEEPPPTLHNQYFISGILTNPQFQVMVRNLVKNEGVEPQVLGNGMVMNGRESTFKVPAALGGHQVSVTPTFGPDESTIELQIRASANANPAVRGAITTGAEIWDGQTVILTARPAGKDKATRCIFITAALIDPSGIPAKK